MMDWDVEMEDTPQAHSLEAHDEATAPAHDTLGADPTPSAKDDTATTGGDPGRVPVPTKIHLRGVDILTTEDITSYVAEHVGGGAADRVEWIDDTSANLVFGSEAAAQDALVALSAVPVADPAQLPELECLPAKPFSAKPDVGLQVRVAVASDRKQAGAYSRSRFYLLHPEYDPEERQRRRERSSRSRYRDRDHRDRDHRHHHHHRRGDSWQRGRSDSYSGRGEEEDNVAYDASFYDDPAPEDADTRDTRARSRRRRLSPPPGDSIRRIGSADSNPSSRRRNESKELFPSRRREPRLRDRSASPRRDSDDRRASLEDNRASAQQVKGRLRASSGPKELFPSKIDSLGLGQIDRLELAGVSGDAATATAAGEFSIRGLAARRGGDDGFTLKGAASTTARVKELFPSKFGDSNNAGKELFADTRGPRGKPRQKAEDLFR